MLHPAVDLGDQVLHGLVKDTKAEIPLMIAFTVGEVLLKNDKNETVCRLLAQ